MYRENILDHYKHPRNFGELPDADVSYEIDNPLCGDRLKLQIKFSPPPNLPLSKGEECKIADIKFTGSGCAISMAAASLLTEYLKNKTRAELLAIDDEVIYKLLGIEINPGRIKCALLPLLGLKEIRCGGVSSRIVTSAMRGQVRHLKLAQKYNTLINPDNMLL